MFITRENYEKALRRAKAEGRKEALREVQINDGIELVRRNLRDSMDFLRRDIEDLKVAVYTKQSGAVEASCSCKSGE